MSLLRPARCGPARVLLAAVAGALCAFPSAAAARPGPAAEPVVVIPGLGSNCIGQRSDDANHPILSGAVADGMRAAHASAGTAVEAVPASRVYGWRFSACGRTLSRLAKGLDDSLAQTQAKHGGGPVDLVSFSFGGAIARYCLANPLGATPKCAGRVDDWVGIVNPSNGTTKADLPACLTAALVTLGPICTSMSYRSLDVKRMNRNDPTPGATEYTILWSPEDEFVYPTGSSRLPGARNVALTSALGKVTHAGSWFGGPCTTTAQWVGLELLDIAPHSAGDETIDCNAAVAGSAGAQ